MDNYAYLCLLKTSLFSVRCTKFFELRDISDR
nr:MAG TPA: hypothetical protein [Caudoviricetes sp.]DAQ62700.1 MAG TPA: hypothetical protein [Caudoviricetes sp.]